MADADVDRLALQHLARDVVQHAVAHVDRIIQPEQPARRRIFVRKILKHALAPDAGLRVFAGRIGCECFIGAFAVHGHEGIDAARRERDDPRAGKSLRHQRRDVRIHCPGQRQIALRAELATGHEDDIRNFRQRLDSVLVEQVAIDGFDAAGVQPVLDAGIAEACNADNAAVGQGGLGEACQRRAHLAGHAQNHDVAIDLAEVVDQRLARTAQQFFERCDIRNCLRQMVAGQQHASSLVCPIAAGCHEPPTNVRGQAPGRTAPRQAKSGG